jgi:hypothetical protein
VLSGAHHVRRATVAVAVQRQQLSDDAFTGVVLGGGSAEVAQILLGRGDRVRAVGRARVKSPEMLERQPMTTVAPVRLRQWLEARKPMVTCV